ncbi:hypothetical protein [Cohaesibacter marisflavi]|uniref:hypothetical protein n=1 Tax=Cohaesibacter marisflavi TaxID=655353 RepID=UPI0029C65FB4|nr:hypothetical protein [Cohaesibacter marisflavi]
MTIPLKDLIPSVKDAPLEPAEVKPLGKEVKPLGKTEPTEIVFGGLDLLLPIAKQPEAPQTCAETQSDCTEAWANGLKDAELLWQEQLSLQRLKLREEFDAMKQVLAAELHRQLHGHVAEQMVEIKNELADQVAEMLQPFLAEQAHRRIIEIFSDVAEQALHDCVADSPILRGPENLLEQLSSAVDCEKLSALVGDVTPQNLQDEPTELSLKVDSCVFETRISDYLTQLEEAVQDD